MEEPSVADRAVRLSNLIKTAHQPVVDSPTPLHHTPPHPGHTLGRDAGVAARLMPRGQESVFAARLLTSTRGGRGPIQGLVLVRPSHQLAAAVGEATRQYPLFIREVTYRPPTHDVCQVRGEYVKTDATVANLRLIMGANAARVQGFITGGCRFSVWASLLILTVAGQVGSRMVQRP